MKTLKCDLCEAVAQGNSFEEWMQNLMPHYIKAHSEIMNNPDKTNEDKQKWMDQNKARFETA